MMRTLIGKEIRALRSYVVLIVGFLFLILLSLFVTEHPDQYPLDPAKWVGNDAGGATMAYMLFGLMIGAGILVNESEQGTLNFLDGLPLSRTRVFFAKIIATVVVLSLLPLLGLSVDVVLGWISRTSISGPFPWKFVFVEAALQLGVLVYIVAVATALSFLRRWLALVLGLIFWGYLWLHQNGAAWVSNFDPNKTIAVGVLNDELQIPWVTLGTQMATAVGLLVISWLGFKVLGDRTEFAVDRLSRNRFLRFMGGGARLLAPVIWVAAMIKIVGGTTPEPGDSSPPLGEPAFGRKETTHFEFLFRDSQRRDTALLMQEADEIHDTVASFLGASPPPSRIVVDLASPVVRHAAGQTNWTKIRLPFEASEGFDRHRLILGHEITHVYIDQLSEGRPVKVFRYARFLHEGLATYVEQKFFASPAEQRANRRAVASAWSRGRIPFETLCDDDALDRTRDRNLVYPLGEVFIASLVKAHGETAPGKLVKALGRKDALMGLQGSALWRDTMQAAGFSLDRTVAIYEGECQGLLDEFGDELGLLPGITAAVYRDGEDIVVHPQINGESPGLRMVCLIDIDDPLGDDLRPVRRHRDGTFRLPRGEYSRPTLRYMLGWDLPGTEQPVFEPWAEAPVN